MKIIRLFVLTLLFLPNLPAYAAHSSASDTDFQLQQEHEYCLERWQKKETKKITHEVDILRQRFCPFNLPNPRPVDRALQKHLANYWFLETAEALVKDGFKHDTLKQLMHLGAKRHMMWTHNGNTALQMAAQRGNILTVAWLIKSKCNVNHQDTDGETALYKAVEAPYDGTFRIPIVQLLIDAKAHVSTTNNEGESALDLAQKNLLSFNRRHDNASLDDKEKHQLWWLKQTIDDFEVVKEQLEKAQKEQMRADPPQLAKKTTSPHACSPKIDSSESKFKHIDYGEKDDTDFIFVEHTSAE